MNIWVVGFAPCQDGGGGTGGFDWFKQYGPAVEKMREHLISSEPEQVHDLTFRKLTFPDHWSDAAIEDWIDGDPELCKEGVGT